MEELAFLKEQLSIPIRPSQSIQEIYGENFIYNPKLYSREYSHFSNDMLSLEALTGRELCIAGEAPVICHAGAATEPALRLLREAGLNLPEVLYTYRTEAEYLQLLETLHQRNKKLIFQYPHSPEDVPPQLSWVEPEIQAYLCDKRSIPDLVPPQNVPLRRTMSLKELLLEKPELPVVLKSGDGQPTSGGCGVMFIENEKQLHELDETFCDLSQLIVEEFIPYDQNISVHYSVNKQGDIKFLGKSEQIVNKDGCFRGSWISVDVDEQLAKIVETGYWVMKKIADKGYVGVAGFDVLIRGSRYYFIDLNVRFNASTCGLLLYPDVRNKYGKAVMRLCNLEWTGNFNSLIPLVEKYLAKGQFIPLSLLDAAYVPNQESISKAVGLVIGHTVAEAEHILKQMTADGLSLRE